MPIRNRLPPWPPLYVAIGSDELAMMETAPGTWMISIRVTAYAVPDPDPNRLVPTMLELQFRPVGSAAQWQQVAAADRDGGRRRPFLRAPVQEGLTYDLRLRAIAMPESVASAWALAQHTVTGEIAPPPPPINLALDLDGTPSPLAVPDAAARLPRRLRGARMPMASRIAGRTPAPLHDGLVSDTRFALPPLGAGTYTFLVKAVDRGGHCSRDAALLVTDYAGYAPINIIQTIDLDAAGFPGDQDSLVYETTPPPPRLCNALLADGPFWTARLGALLVGGRRALLGRRVCRRATTRSASTCPSRMPARRSPSTGRRTGPWVVEYRTAGDSAFWARHTPYFWETADAVLLERGHRRVAPVAGRARRPRAALRHPLVHAGPAGGVPDPRASRLRRGGRDRRAWTTRRCRPCPTRLPLYPARTA